ncbi:hypothetical protein [Pseudochrobactrum sp. MP213Fo]|uniref:hypothetical protein n=1 Tax=Pseudochrobactrum sp. MP213Fo TaxID=3022250 RepID=UPI003B9F48E4
MRCFLADEKIWTSIQRPTRILQIIKTVRVNICIEEIIARLASTFEDQLPLINDLRAAITKLEKTNTKYKLDVEFIHDMADEVNSMGAVLRHIAEKEEGISPELKRKLQTVTKKDESHN